MRLFAGLMSILSLCSIGSAERPNILIAISDDQSYPHASAYGTPVIETPAFDRVARQGVLFENAFTPAPGCSPMRAAFLTGREIWQLREAGTHASFFPRDLPVFTEQLAESGYHVGMTGKGWGPGQARGWTQNPAGKSYGSRKIGSHSGISSNDYAANFADFLDAAQADRPFCFWFGASEPHRPYEPGIGERHGIDPASIELPPLLPDHETVRDDVANYFLEIQWFDSHLARMLNLLQAQGRLENTLVIVTSDNGMPFPRAKANLYEYGIHMPLAICWPRQIAGDRKTSQLVSLIDVTRTILDAAGVDPMQADLMPGRSLLPWLRGATQAPAALRTEVFSGRERHSSSRYNSLGYPCRCIRTATHLYIRNFTPERWPAGAPQKYDRATYDVRGTLVDSRLGKPHGGYHDIDNGPTLQAMIAGRDQPSMAEAFRAAVEHRPAEELFDIKNDPGCCLNLASSPAHAAIKQDLASRLTAYLTRTGDLRQTDPDAAQLWESYPRVSSLRWFPPPPWVESETAVVPTQPWLESRRPRPQPESPQPESPQPESPQPESPQPGR
jgi:uncharacterized sulfatase